MEGTSSSLLPGIILSLAHGQNESLIDPKVPVGATQGRAELRRDEEHTVPEKTPCLQPCSIVLSSWAWSENKGPGARDPENRAELYRHTRSLGYVT